MTRQDTIVPEKKEIVTVDGHMTLKISNNSEKSIDCPASAFRDVGIRVQGFDEPEMISAGQIGGSEKEDVNSDHCEDGPLLSGRAFTMSLRLSDAQFRYLKSHGLSWITVVFPNINRWLESPVMWHVSACQKSGDVCGKHGTSMEKDSDLHSSHRVETDNTAQRQSAQWNERKKLDSVESGPALSDDGVTPCSDVEDSHSGLDDGGQRSEMLEMAMWATLHGNRLTHCGGCSTREDFSNSRLFRQKVEGSPLDTLSIQALIAVEGFVRHVNCLIQSPEFRMQEANSSPGGKFAFAAPSAEEEMDLRLADLVYQHFDDLLFYWNGPFSRQFPELRNSLHRILQVKASWIENADAFAGIRYWVGTRFPESEAVDARTSGGEEQIYIEIFPVYSSRKISTSDSSDG